MTNRARFILATLALLFGAASVYVDWRAFLLCAVGVFFDNIIRIDNAKRRSS